MKNIIFDMGNVLLRFDPVGYLLTLTDEESALKVWEVTVGHNDWLLFDQGVLSDIDLISQASQRIESTYHSLVEAIVVYSYTKLEPIEGMETLLQDLKEQGYHLYLLSNVSQKFYDYYHHYSILSYFEGYVISSDIKVNKPSPIIYQTLLEHYSLNPNETIFIDDSHVNVEGAKVLGIESIVFESVTQLKNSLSCILK